jgi:hypothetical protein
MRITHRVNMRISGVIYPPSKKFPAFISTISDTNEITVIDIFTHNSYRSISRANGSFISYKERANGIELKFLEKGSNYFYYMPYYIGLRFSQSYNTITKLFNFAHDNQTLYYTPKTISSMFNYTNLRPSLQNYIILCDVIDVRDIRGLIFSIWSDILLADKNGYEIIDEFDTRNQLWTLVELLLG